MGGRHVRSLKLLEWNTTISFRDTGAKNADLFQSYDATRNWNISCCLMPSNTTSHENVFLDLRMDRGVPLERLVKPPTIQLDFFQTSSVIKNAFGCCLGDPGIQRGPKSKQVLAFHLHGSVSPFSAARKKFLAQPFFAPPVILIHMTIRATKFGGGGEQVNVHIT